MTEIRPVSSDEFLPEITPWLRWSGTTIGIALICGLVGSAFIPYQETVRVSGSIRPQGEVLLVQAPTNGIIVRIQGKENQVVEAGEVIVALDEQVLRGQQERIHDNQQQIKRQILQVEAQISSIQRQYAAEQERGQQSLLVGAAEYAERERTYQDRTKANQMESIAATSTLEQQLAELAKLSAEATAQKANLKSALSALAAAREKRDRYRRLSTAGAISQQQQSEIEAEVIQKEQAVIAQQSNQQAQLQQMQGQRQSIVAARARAVQQQQMLSPDRSPLENATAQIERTRASTQATLATIERELEALIQQKAALTQQVTDNQQQLQQIDRQRSQALVRAPVRGTLFAMKIRNPSQVVSVGETIARIAPQDTQLVVKARVSAKEIGKIHLCRGQFKPKPVCKQGKAQVKVTTFPFPDYGAIDGAVSQITPDSIANSTLEEKTEEPGYELTITLAQEYLERQGQQYRLQPGMAIVADVVAREDTLLRYFARQLRLIADL